MLESSVALADDYLEYLYVGLVCPKSTKAYISSTILLYYHTRSFRLFKPYPFSQNPLLTKRFSSRLTSLDMTLVFCLLLPWLNTNYLLERVSHYWAFFKLASCSPFDFLLSSPSRLSISLMLSLLCLYLDLLDCDLSESAFYEETLGAMRLL